MWHVTKYFPSDVTIEYTIIKFVKPSDVDIVRQLNEYLNRQQHYGDIMSVDSPFFNPQDEMGMPIPKEKWQWNYAMTLISKKVGEQKFSDIYSKLELFSWNTELNSDGKFIQFRIRIPSREFFDKIEEKENITILSQALNYVFRCRIKIDYEIMTNN